MMSKAVQGPDEDNTNEATTIWMESCQEIKETTCEHSLSTKGSDERQNLQVISRSEGSFWSFKHCRTHEEREGLGDGREVGPRDAKFAYFHNLID